MPDPPASSNPITTRTLLAELGGDFRSVAGETGLDRLVDHPRIQKSGLALAGHLVGIVPTRVQILGETEISYLETLPADLARERLARVFALSLSCVVVTRGIDPPAALIEVARATATPLVVAASRSSAAISVIHAALDRLLAPRTAMHGVMIEVHGLGILLVGPSGIGKSECALVLIERGHRLVADDRVELVRMPGDKVVATSPALLKHHVEIRGLGVLDVRAIFGATAVRDSAPLDLVVELCRLEDGDFDRLGLDERSTDVLGVPIPSVRIPVYPGRDLGVLLEVAARNELLKRAGVRSARDFADRIERALGVPREGPRR